MAKKKSPTAALNPDWDSGNRQIHFSKHGKKVASLIKWKNRTSSSFGKWDYDKESKQAVNRARFWFEADHWEAGKQKDPRRSYFVDSRMLWAITDLKVADFVTCYPMTMDGAFTEAELSDLPDGVKLMEFSKWFDFQMNTEDVSGESGNYRNVKVKHDTRPKVL